MKWKITKCLKTQQPLKLEKKITHRFGNLRLLEFFDVCLTKFDNNQILLNKISHRFPLTTKLFAGWKILIAEGQKLEYFERTANNIFKRMMKIVYQNHAHIWSQLCSICVYYGLYEEIALKKVKRGWNIIITYCLLTPL